MHGQPNVKYGPILAVFQAIFRTFMHHPISRYALYILATYPANISKAVPLQAWSGPEGSRKLRFPDFMTMAQDGGKVVSLTHRPPLPPKIFLVFIYNTGVLV
jgi:hypothetical protein